MNETAKKLRDITQNAVVTPGSGKPYSVIATIKSAFGFDSILAPGVLLQFMAAIADEMDELQAEANDANNLRQKLDSAEKKAERRKQHIGYLETALHDKNALLEQRGGTIARLTAENGKLRKQVPTERERQILAMWPHFEDGEPVMIGDGVDGLGGEIIEVYIAENAAAIWNNFGHHMHLSLGERVKRPAPEVLDADGVLIKAGDTVWHEDGSELHVIGFGDAQDGETMLVVKYAAGPTKWGEVRCLSVTHTRPAPKVLDADGVEIKVGDTVYEPNGQSGIVTAVHPSTRCVDLRQDGCDAYAMDTKRLAHTRPDSWERFVEDMQKSSCAYFGYLHKECDKGDGCPARGGARLQQPQNGRPHPPCKGLAGVEVD